jgi:arylsulfatase
MIGELRANDPAKPFFLYFAHQAVHGPVQAKEQDLETYRGRYDAGWDHIRDERFARQIEIGLFGPDTRCAPRNREPGADVVPWDSLSEAQQRTFARYMEAFAAAVDNVDQNLARLIARLKAMGEYENTIFVFTSDNGGTSEGGDTGTRSYFSRFGGVRTGLPEDWEPDVPRDPDLIGGPQTYVHYPRGWAYASNTPFRMYKTYTHGGGVRVPMLVSWPAGLPRAADDDGVRHQYAYATDIGATLLRLAGVEPLADRAGIPARPADGVAFDHWLRDASLPTLHTEQYTELNGRRAFIEGDLKAIAPAPNGPGWVEGGWELYDVAADPTETRDLAPGRPDAVARLAERWRASAWENQVFPLNDDGSFNRNRPATELALEAPVTLFPGAPTLERYRSAKLVRLRSFTIEVDLHWREGDAGVLLAHGDQGGGYQLRIEDGRLVLAYNQYGAMRHASAPLEPGARSVTVDFTALPAFRWAIAVKVDGRPAFGLDEVTMLIGMAPFAGISVGLDRGGPVDWELYRRRGCFRYDGELASVRYVPGPKADYNPEVILEMDRQLVAAFD